LSQRQRPLEIIMLESAGQGLSDAVFADVGDLAQSIEQAEGL